MRIANIQMNSSDNTKENFSTIINYIEQAAYENADIVCFPENCNIIAENKQLMIKSSPPEEQNEDLLQVAKTALDNNIWVFLGSFPVLIEKENKLANRSFVINNKGKIVARYDKIHLFDAVISDTESYRESNNYIAGNEAVTVNTPWCDIGLTICYDIRFPSLYRYLAHKGAKIICIPAAFVVTTGKAHWEVLLRARAIETGCYIIASAQYGEHAGGRKTYGHSMIVNPWGKIIAEEQEQRSSILITDIDLEYVDIVRNSLPNLQCESDIW